MTAGSVYEAFGRATSIPGGTTLPHHGNDRIYRETEGTERQTWELDAAHRFRSWTGEPGSGSTWATGATARYGWLGREGRSTDTVSGPGPWGAKDAACKRCEKALTNGKPAMRRW
ncbi:hypothetical protein [Streptomyces cyaneofuscatus]|uniref:hypothetical protein n=1 Tax=Streptomyces cyaneofuscatus TaxID=66883 RepID=UPI003650A665